MLERSTTRGGLPDAPPRHSRLGTRGGKPVWNHGPTAAPGEALSRERSGLRSIAIVFIVIGICTATSWLLFDPNDLVNILMLYVLGAALCAFVLSRFATGLAAALSVGAFDFLYVPPRFSLRVNDSRYLVTFASLLVVSLVISNLAARSRMQVTVARQRESHNRALFELSREFANTRELDQIFKILCRRASIELGTVVRVVRFPAAENGEARPAAPESAMLIRVSGRPIAQLELVEQNPEETLGAEEGRLLEGFVSLAGVAVERAMLLEAAEGARRLAETQEVRNLLLSSISHDLRTPLTVILGSASSLLEHGAGLEPETERLLLEGIANEAKRMSGLLGNILDMTWLESGAVELNKEWNDLEELFTAARAPLAGRLEEGQLQVYVEPGLPLVQCDGGLISQVIGNLLGNAIDHTQKGTRIQVKLTKGGEKLYFSVRDYGAGLPSGGEDEVFLKFYQAHPEAHRSGMGLGLAICKTILELHGGEVHARNHRPEGAEFWFALPLSPGGTPTGSAEAERYS